jgi:hypothetical protein
VLKLKSFAAKVKRSEQQFLSQPVSSVVLMKEHRQLSFRFLLRGTQHGMADDAPAHFHYELREAKLTKLGEPLFDLRGGAWR